jgi:RecB family exonuclease
VTRARAELLVTAVAGTEEQPSAFVDVLDPVEGTRQPAEVPPALTLRGLVARLRRDLLVAHRQGDRAARDRAAARLDRLVRAGAPGADPQTWWDARELSDDRRLQEEGAVRVSPSRVQTFDECALRWLLSTRGGDARGAAAASLGTLVHDVVAEQPEADLEALDTALGERWHELGLGDGWADRRDRERARDMLRRYVDYVASSRASGFELVEVEVDVDVTVGAARILGRADRVERDAEGRLRVVDLKTGASKPAQSEVARHPQLGVYQVAMAEDPAAAAGTAGAALVQIGRAAGVGPSVQVQPPLEEAEDPRWAHDLLQRTAEGMVGSSFAATAGPWCRTCQVRFSCPVQPEGRTLR